MHSLTRRSAVATAATARRHRCVLNTAAVLGGNSNCFSSNHLMRYQPTLFFHSTAGFSTKTSSIDESKESQRKDTRSVRQILFPSALPDPQATGPNASRTRYPKTFSEWKRAFSCAWYNYRSTWDGFMGGSSDAKNADERAKQQAERSEMEEIIEEERQTVKGNIEKNTAFIKEEAPKFFDFLKQETKIYTKEDLKEWAGEQLKLATLCVNEFMGGYRSGRDGEMDKMINEYFQEEELEEKESDEAPNRRRRRRRKVKRLIRTA